MAAITKNRNFLKWLKLLFLAWRPSWLEVGIIGHNFGRGPFLCEFPIGSYVKLSSAVAAILIEGPNAGHIFGKEPSNDNFKLLYCNPERAQI
jgi:hypothetical protein